ncbi:MAG: von Willebrand factor type [Planctomycetaceae bacterium]|nr:von Willebrand factor type [Planctomycetaceae bacterium]
MIRDLDLDIERRRNCPRRSAGAWPAWLVSLCVHAALGACCVLGFDYSNGMNDTQAGDGGAPLQLTTRFSSDETAGGFGADLEAEMAQQAVEVIPDRPADDQPLTPVERTHSATTIADSKADPDQVQEATAEETAMPETVARANGTRSIKQKYGQLLQAAATSSRTAFAMSENPGERTRTVKDGHTAGTTGSTSFFEIGAQGNLFGYVVDCSSSMEEENSIGMARAELIASLEQLEPTQRFQILFYDSELHPMTKDRQQTFHATDGHITLARQFIASQQPTSGTIHKPALLAALKLAPDVIYFLTDGETPELSERDLWELKRANRKRVQIHVVEFGIGAQLGSLDWLEQLARDHQGSYRYLDVSR